VPKVVLVIESPSKGLAHDHSSSKTKPLEMSVSLRQRMKHSQKMSQPQAKMNAEAQIRHYLNAEKLLMPVR
jgi:hypothetical protein